jgi:flagellin
MSSLTIQTNIASLIAQNNLRMNNLFQQQTITRLTSGYRINMSGDDAAGLAIANGYRSSISELTQGVRNANDGVSTLQIVDGGLNNISTILDRLKTLATQSASGTFTGDRNTLNNEYQTLLGEVTRQASNIGLNAGGTNNTTLNVYIGGTTNLTNAQVTVNLAGAANQVDAAGLGLSNTNVAASGTELTVGVANAVQLNNSVGNFSGTQVFNFYVPNSAAPVAVTYDGTGVANGDSTAALSKLNASIQAAGLTGITASMAADGRLQFSGGGAFAVQAQAGANGLATAGSGADVNSGLYGLHSALATVTAGTETDVVSNAQGTVTLNFTAANAGSLANMMSYANSQLNAIGISVTADSAGTGFSVQSATNFTVNQTAAGTGSVFAGGLGAQALTNASPTSSGAAAETAIAQINASVAQLGLVQGRVGTGENELSYAINLANSQISSFSAAQSRIRDADMAAEAANLTKAQVLQQASLAAMAQANAAPQAVLALLK